MAFTIDQATPTRWPLPCPRGPVGNAVVHSLRTEEPLGADSEVWTALEDLTGLLDDDDLQITLAILHELRFHGIEGIRDGQELRADLHAVRTRLDDAHMEQVIGTVEPGPVTVETLGDLIREAVSPQRSGGSGLGRRLSSKGTMEEFAEYFVHRSLYLLREADAHSYAIPWLEPRVKHALMEIQFDEYGSGRLPDMHANLFADTMRSVGLDHRYGAYIDHVPAVTLADLNMLSAWTSTRARRGFLMGNLCALEGTSSLSSKSMSARLQRLGCSEETRKFYDVHVLADAVHEEIAITDLAVALAETDPDTCRDIYVGVLTFLSMEDRIGRHIVNRWDAGKTSLRRPLPERQA